MYSGIFELDILKEARVPTPVGNQHLNGFQLIHSGDSDP
jgi:hypothetical protein